LSEKILGDEALPVKGAANVHVANAIAADRIFGSMFAVIDVGRVPGVGSWCFEWPWSLTAQVNNPFIIQPTCTFVVTTVRAELGSSPALQPRRHQQRHRNRITHRDLGMVLRTRVNRQVMVNNTQKCKCTSQIEEGTTDLTN
jgi:hypothetical protein